MAGIEPDRLGFTDDGLADFAFQLGSQAFQGGGQARTNPAISPDQLFRQGRQCCPATTIGI